MRILLLLLLLPFFSCAQQEPTAADTQDAALTFELDSLTKERCVGESCATLRLVWPVAKGQHADQVNRIIRAEVDKYMMFGDDPTPTRDSLIAGYFRMFEEQKSDFPDWGGGYELEVEGKLSYQSDSTVSLHFGWMSYLGGAHPNYGEEFLNFHAKSGEYLSLDRLITDQERLRESTEKKFREFHQVAEGVSLEEDGRFFLPETGFFLANAMGFQEEKFWIVYVPYEIGPYVMGFTELEFTKKELGDLVRW